MFLTGKTKMKKIMIALFVLSSLTAFASDKTLLLDAACKVRCLVNVTETANEGGVLYERDYETVFADYIGLSREQLETETESPQLTKLCKNKFFNSIVSGSIDCFYFKH